MESGIELYHKWGRCRVGQKENSRWRGSLSQNIKDENCWWCELEKCVETRLS